MSAPIATAAAQLEQLAESGSLDQLAWALTGVLLSAAERLAPEAATPYEAAWIVAGRFDPGLRPEIADHRRPLGPGDQVQTHEGRTPAGKQDGATFEEDDRSGLATSTDKV